MSSAEVGGFSVRPDLLQLRHEKNELKKQIDKLRSEVGDVAQKVGGVYDKKGGLSKNESKLESLITKYENTNSRLEAEIKKVASHKKESMMHSLSTGKDVKALEMREAGIQKMVDNVRKDVDKLNNEGGPSLTEYFSGWFREPSPAEIKKAETHEEALAEKVELLGQLKQELIKTSNEIGIEKGEKRGE